MSDGRIQKEQAIAIARACLSDDPHKDDIERVFQDEYTIETPLCFVFFYQSRSFPDTGVFEHMLAGNAPILIDRRNGQAHWTGTREPIEYYIQKFESENPG